MRHRASRQPFVVTYICTLLTKRQEAVETVPTEFEDRALTA